ncbi:MAG: FKBP-type peptidyl-prolyl cis-trans isomerase [Casimicrobiaceae bacterium]
MNPSTRFRLFTAIVALPAAVSCVSVTADKPAAATAPAMAGSAASAPVIVDGMKIVEMKVGSGKEAQTGKAAMVQYTGWLYDDKAPDNKGKQFDSTSTRGGLAFGFIVGVGRVIKGWDQGVVGMKVGGTRTLTIPAALAYGDKDVGNGLIPPNSTLVFDIELVDVKP